MQVLRLDEMMGNIYLSSVVYLIVNLRFTSDLHFFNFCLF